MGLKTIKWHKTIKWQALIALLSALVFWAALSNTPAYAQQDIGDIIEDIFKIGEAPKPEEETDPYRFGRIDHIPVEIRHEMGEDELPVDAVLIVSAYAPPPPNVRRANPLLLGETRLLLSGLSSPLQIIIAAPSAITQELAYVRLEARVVDGKQNTVLSLKTPAAYKGYDAPILELTPTDASSALETGLPSDPAANSPENFEVETVRGKVRLNGKAPKFKGSNLVVRLTEDGLAGGNSQTVLGEARQILDGKTTPFSFEFDRVIDPVRTGMPLALEVWIEDWAGRKTHVTPAPTPYTGPKTRYRIRLDAIGPQVRSKMPKLPNTKRPKAKTPKPKIIVPETAKPPKPKPKAKPSPQPTFISGRAKFNAFKGLPKGSVLIATLERSRGKRPVILARTRLPLDGLSGHIDFRINTKKVNLSPNRKTPVLRVRIQDKNGKLFFSNPGGTRLVQGLNTVTLKTSPHY